MNLTADLCALPSSSTTVILLMNPTLLTVTVPVVDSGPHLLIKRSYRMAFFIFFKFETLSI